MERTMKFVAVGKSDLLTHNPAQMQVPRKAGPVGTAIPTPEVEAERGLYLDGQGRYCLPGVGFRNAFIKAAGQFRGTWQKKRENLRALVSHCVVSEELLPILDEQLQPTTRYLVDSRRAVVQRQGIIRSRPKFPNWRVVFELVYDDEILSAADPESLRALFTSVLNDAGQRIGVGDYRPEKTGWFGRFSVE